MVTYGILIGVHLDNIISMPGLYKALAILYCFTILSCRLRESKTATIPLPSQSRYQHPAIIAIDTLMPLDWKGPECDTLIIRHVITADGRIETTPVDSILHSRSFLDPSEWSYR